MSNAKAKTIALIPARGGSKGLPGKNIRPLAGKPLIQHTIEAALQSPAIDVVYVSTDDTAISRTAKAGGAHVIERPADLATDEAASIDVVRHFLDWHQKEKGAWPKILALLQPTSPLRNVVHLTEALARFRELPQPASVISVTTSKPLSWQGTVDEEGRFTGWQTTDLSKNRQTETLNYVLNGAIYISTPQRFYDGELMTPFVYSYLMNPEASVDIDTLADFELAEMLLLQQSSWGQD